MKRIIIGLKCVIWNPEEEIMAFFRFIRMQNIERIKHSGEGGWMKSYKYGYNLYKNMLWIANTLVRMTEHVTVRHTLLSHACGLSWFMFGHVFGCISEDRTLRQLNVMWIHVYKMWIYYIKRLVDVIYLHCIYLKILRHGDLMWVKEKRIKEETMHLQ